MPPAGSGTRTVYWQAKIWHKSLREMSRRSHHGTAYLDRHGVVRFVAYPCKRCGVIQRLPSAGAPAALRHCGAWVYAEPAPADDADVPEDESA